MPGLTGDIGEAKFTLFADTKSFETGLMTAERAAEKAAQKIQKDMERTASETARATQKMGQGLMQLGYAIDDLQYGFRAIVNNIPQIVSQLTGSAGLGAAVGITAVAINQFAMHWDELMDSLSDATGIDRAKSNLESFSDWARARGDWLMADTANWAGAGQDLQKEIAKDKEKAEKLVGIGGKIAEESSAREETAGALFKRTIKEYGEKQLFADLVKQQTPPGATPSQKKWVEDEVKKQLAEGAAGHKMPDEFGPVFGVMAGRNTLLDEHAQQRKFEKEGEENVKKFELGRSEEIAQRHKFEAEGQRNVEKFNEKQFEAGMDAMDMELGKIKDAWEENHKKEIEHKQGFIQDKENQAREVERSVRNREPSQIFSSVHAFSNNLLTAAMDNPAKQAHKDAEAIRDGIRGLREELRKQQRVEWDN